MALCIKVSSAIVDTIPMCRLMPFTKHGEFCIRIGGAKPMQITSAICKQNMPGLNLFSSCERRDGTL